MSAEIMPICVDRVHRTNTVSSFNVCKIKNLHTYINTADLPYWWFRAMAVLICGKIIVAMLMHPCSLEVMIVWAPGVKHYRLHLPTLLSSYSDTVSYHTYFNRTFHNF